MKKNLYRITENQEVELSLEDIKHIIRQMDIEDLDEIDRAIEQAYSDDWDDWNEQ